MEIREFRKGPAGRPQPRGGGGRFQAGANANLHNISDSLMLPLGGACGQSQINPSETASV